MTPLSWLKSGINRIDLSRSVISLYLLKDLFVLISIEISGVNIYLQTQRSFDVSKVISQAFYKSGFVEMQFLIYLYKYQISF